MKMAEESNESTTIKIKIKIPTRESIVENLKQMFPMLEVELEGEEEQEQPQTEDQPEEK